MSCKQYTIEVNSGATATLVSYPVLDFVAQKGILTATDTTNQRAGAYEMFLSYTQESLTILPEFVLYAGIGDSLNYSVDAVYNSITLEIEVRITNNEAVKLRIDLAETGTIS